MERFQSTCYSYYFDAQLDLICSARASSMPPTVRNVSGDHDQTEKCDLFSTVLHRSRT